VAGAVRRPPFVFRSSDLGRRLAPNPEPDFRFGVLW